MTATLGNSYDYDANGNQTGRTIGGVAYTFTFDYENRITEVKQGITSIASFVYDADGNRVKGTVSGVTTVYVAGVYEYQGGATTKYYEGNAMRRTSYASGNGVQYLLRDHLGSSSVIVNQDGTVAKSEFYYPYGGNRGTAFSTLTAKRFTGQYHESGLPGGEGLSDYNARWYDAQLGRFVSADTIVPDPGNPQDLNRLAYVRGNPLNFRDPSGHLLEQGAGGGGGKYRLVIGLNGIHQMRGKAAQTIWALLNKIAINSGVATFQPGPTFTSRSSLPGGPDSKLAFYGSYIIDSINVKYNHDLRYLPYLGDQDPRQVLRSTIRDTAKAVADGKIQLDGVKVYLVAHSGGASYLVPYAKYLEEEYGAEVSYVAPLGSIYIDQGGLNQVADKVQLITASNDWLGFKERAERAFYNIFGGTTVSSVTVGPGGHTGYGESQEVINLIVDQVTSP